MKKEIFNKAILINYLIQIIVPLIFVIIWLIVWIVDHDFKNLIFMYNFISTSWIMLIIDFPKDTLYIMTLSILLFKYIFVLFYVKLLWNKNKLILSISIITSIITSIIWAFYLLIAMSV